MKRVLLFVSFGLLVLVAACTVICLDSEKEQSTTIIIDQGSGSLEPVILKPKPAIFLPNQIE